MHESSKSLSMTPGIFASWFHLALGTVLVLLFEGLTSTTPTLNMIHNIPYSPRYYAPGNNRANQEQTWVEQCMSHLKAYL